MRAGSPSCSHAATEAKPTPPRHETASPPRHETGCFLIVHSVAKRHNIGTIARCATAFNVKEILLVGSNSFNSFGSFGATDYVKFRHFPTLEKACTHLREVEQCRIVGVEITPEALPIDSHPFSGPTAFILGNEGQGLSPKQVAMCDSFVYIPQYGAGTASLNVAVATAIVLHHFALWAGYQEREREGGKFLVAERPDRRTQARGMVPRDPEEVRRERQERRARRQSSGTEGEQALGLESLAEGSPSPSGSGSDGERGGEGAADGSCGGSGKALPGSATSGGDKARQQTTTHQLS